MGNIPIILNNCNRLSTTKKLVEDLITLGYNNIHILDNNSSYPPLLEWYSEIEASTQENPIKVFRIGHNSGQLALWNTGYINQFQNEPYIVYSDSDIELPETEDIIEGLINVLDFYGTARGISKVGLALEINDLPNTELAIRIQAHESKYWDNKISKVGKTGVYVADVDTTFALIKPTEPFTYKALRVAGWFTAKHIPWYTDWSNLSEEEKYVLDHLDNKYSTYKGYYLQWLEKQVV